MESNTWEALAAIMWNYFTITGEFWHLADAVIGVFNSSNNQVCIYLLLGPLMFEYKGNTGLKKEEPGCT